MASRRARAALDKLDKLGVNLKAREELELEMKKAGFGIDENRTRRDVNWGITDGRYDAPTGYNLAIIHLQALSHPLWTIVTDERQNRDIISQFPSFFGANRWAGVKPNLTRVLAMSNLAAAEAPVGTVAPVAPTPVKPPSFFDSLQKNLGSPPFLLKMVSRERQGASRR